MFNFNVLSLIDTIVKFPICAFAPVPEVTSKLLPFNVQAKLIDVVGLQTIPASVIVPVLLDENV